MYRNIIFVFFLGVVLCCPSVIALQANNADNSMVVEEVGSLSAFLNSNFVRTSVWPGIGPFHSSSNNHWADPSGNQLIYSTANKQISLCQLEMRGGANEAQCMLNLQMSVDFLLESLGLKPVQIHAVNVEVNKSSKLLIGNNYNPIHINVAPFLVSLQNLGITEGTDNYLYRIVVANQNLASGDLEINKADENKNSNEKIDEGKTIEVAEIPDNNATANAKSIQTSDKKINPSIDKKIKAFEKNDKQFNGNRPDDNINDSVPNGSINPDLENGRQPATAPKTLSKDEQLKKDFRDVIQNWQTLKKTTVKERDTKLLSQALAGKALVRQTDAIKWLVSNHKYYDMTPGGAKIEKVSALAGTTKYAVYAEVKEKTKYVDELSGKVVKETNDTYRVNYTIEKVGQKWLITDYSLIKGDQEKNADKSGSNNKLRKPASQKSAKPASITPHL